MISIPTLAEFKFSQDEITNEYINSHITKDSLDNIQKHYSNGLSKYIEKIEVEIVSDIKNCERLWRGFSPKNSLFDTWDFRYPFHKNYNFNTYFITVKNESYILGVLPLCYDSIVSGFRWFGTSWQEDNVFFVREIEYLPLLLFLAPKPLSLFAIKEEETKRFPTTLFQPDDSKYVLNLKNNSSLDFYLSTLKKKKRYNLRRDVKRISKLNPKVYTDRFEDYDKMVEIAKKRFSQKGELTDWEEEPSSIGTFRDIISYNKDAFKPKIISVEIDGKLAGCDLIAVCKDFYYTLKGGYDVSAYPGIGNYLNIYEIEDALSLGMKYIDFLQIDYGWKKSMFEEVPLFKYEVKKQ